MISVRHIRRGTMRVLWVDTITDREAPTVAELEAGTDLSQWVSMIDGFEIDRPLVGLPIADPTGELLSAFGFPRVIATPTLMLYDEGSSTSAVQTLLAGDEVGHVVVCLDGAPSASDRCLVWPVVASGGAHRVTAGLEAAQWRVTFAVWAAPGEAVIAS